MDTQDPHSTDRDTEPDDTAELEAARAALRAQHQGVEVVDPEIAAMKEDPEFHAAIETRRQLAAWEPPPAPEPVEIAGEGGALLVQAKAAATYVAPVEVTQAEAPRPPSGPVKIAAEVDPRRQKTVRIQHRDGKEPVAELGDGPPAAAAEADASAKVDATAEAEADPRAPRTVCIRERDGKEIVVELGDGPPAVTVAKPGATATRDRGDAAREAMRSGTYRITARDDDGKSALQEDVPPGAHVAPAGGAVQAAEPSGGRSVARQRAGDEPEASSPHPVAQHGRRHGLMIGAAIIFAAGGISVLALLRPPERAPDTASSATAPQAVPSTAPTAVAASAQRVEAPAPSMTASSTAAETASAAPSVSAPSGVVDAPATATPSMPSALLAPKTSGDPYADAAAPVVKSAPSAAPVVTAAPSMQPSAPPVMAAPTAKPRPTSTAKPAGGTKLDD